jgi:hypothetical protein
LLQTKSSLKKSEMHFAASIIEVFMSTLNDYETYADDTSDTSKRTLEAYSVVRMIDQAYNALHGHHITFCTRYSAPPPSPSPSKK